MTYGNLPDEIGVFNVKCQEMMFYQYLPIKLSETTKVVIEPRLAPLESLIGASCCDFIGVYGLDRYVKSYVYLSAKYLFQMPKCPFNRLGYHSDGFMTEDINYIWSDCCPTIFNDSDFRITPDDKLSLKEMEDQAYKKNEVTYPDNVLLRLDQSVIHKVGEVTEAGLRSFVKISISKDKYDLLGNSHNYLLDYKWDMKPRKLERNMPQTEPFSPL